MTAAEIQFCLAEAKQLIPALNFAGTAQSYFEEGVKQSFRTLGVTGGAAAADAILKSGKNLSDWEASTDIGKAIQQQKWLALAKLSGLEEYGLNIEKQFPGVPQCRAYHLPIDHRLFCQTQSLARNSNLSSAGVIDVFAVRMFWDID
ncbi:MAG: SusD/RagB family nutrient-binding outer membrane lipoprotein [Saprospiraceae bacterium]|nr:SusD/RagB family nutrient-binding outer membrane lipoprotein [Saprospiraceae bacterium]